jgi:hypothetical protein
MKRFRFAAAIGAACLGLIFGGCHGGNPNQVSIEIVPVTTPTSSGTSIDVGATQPLNFTAQLANDLKNQGVTWKITGSTCSGNGCGTLSNATPFAVSYLAPASLPTSSSLSITLTATSVAMSTVTATETITVDEIPVFATTECNPAAVLPCVLPNGNNGKAYGPVTPSITGGVTPYTYKISAGGLPPGLTMNNIGTIAGTPSGGSSTSTFTIQVTDSGGAAPVTQAFVITVDGPEPLSITTTSLPPAVLNNLYGSAVAVSGGVTPIQWSIISGGLPPGLNLTSSNGEISGTPNPSDTGPYNFTVEVQDSALPTHQTATQALTITVTPLQTFLLTTPPGPLGAGTTATAYNATLQATGGIQPYTWSVAQGQLPAGLTLSATGGVNGTISGTPILVGSSTFTVQVTDSESTPVTRTASFSIAVSAGTLNDTLFSGSYAFRFTGFDTGGSVAIIGTITADGKGNITSGTEEVNRVSGVAPGVTVVPASTNTTTGVITGSTYSIDSNGDGRGTLMLETTFGQLTVDSDYQLVLEPDGSVRFFQDHPTPPPTNPDTVSTHGEGIMKPMIGSSFSASTFSGNYAFEFTGEDLNTKPVALAGVVHADGTAQTLTPGTSDFNDAGTYGSQPITGTFTFTASNIGTAQFTFAVPQSTQITLNFAYMFVSGSDLYFIETDESTTGSGAPTNYRMSGEMVLQQTNVTFNASTLAGTSVATGTGIDSGGNASVFAGLLSTTACDGATTNTLSDDENDAGAITSASLEETCTVTQAGRAAFTWVQPSPPFVAAYLTGPGQGFLIGSDATVSTGLLEQQTAGSAIALTSVEGQYALATPFPGETQVNNLLGETSADGAGNFLGTVDEVDSPGTTAHLDQSFAATIAGLAANGRGTMTATGTVPTGFPTQWIFYVLSSGSIRAIPADTSNQHPQVIFFGP